MTENYMDITPTPRVLRILGEIPFQPWQCIAELIDNSIDAISDAKRTNTPLQTNRITVAWSNESVTTKDRSIEVIDSGPGMTIEKIRDAARAGYTSNDPFQNLGLFGMGFNIATARLGEKTILLSATSDSSYWIGIEIDFSKMINSRDFLARIISIPKDKATDQGTKVIVTGLKDGIYDYLISSESQVRRQLENVYSPLLTRTETEILVQGKRLYPRNPCVWSESRYVLREGVQIPAIIKIDRILGAAYFNIEKNRYLSLEQEAEVKYKLENGEQLQNNIIERQRRLIGWLGIQRYSDPNDFGLDFVRNGRKILIANKSLFNYENPLTGTSILEYPIELGTTVGGRIVGELHVDFLLPTYQKNDFDRSDNSWFRAVEIIRGNGPILPQQRKNMGYSDSNNSPLGYLINGYRRSDPGTKCLAIDRTLANEYTKLYRSGDSEYQNDDKWWLAAIEVDRLKATGGAGKAAVVDGGDQPSDDPSKYGLSADDDGNDNRKKPTESLPNPKSRNPAQESSTLAELIIKSKAITSLSGSYTYSYDPPVNVKVWELSSGDIINKGESVPCAFFSEGIECDFVYNLRNIIFSQFPVTPKSILLVYLAEKFKARDSQNDIVSVYSKLMIKKMKESRIDKLALQEKADQVFRIIREKMISQLQERAVEVIDCIQESIGETEETVNALLSNPSLINKFQNQEPEGLRVIEFVPVRTLLRLVDKFPQNIFDRQVFNALYTGIFFSDVKATERLRVESKDRILSFLKDALMVINQKGGNNSPGTQKLELSRASISIDFLLDELDL